MPAIPDHSELITTLEEARAYYQARLVGIRQIAVKGRPVYIVFERSITHLYSEEVATFEGVPPAEKVLRNLPGGHVERRRFSLERARCLDRVLPTLSNYCKSIKGTGARGRENRLVFGWPTADGRAMCVALAPWRGEPMKWTCVSAYLVSAQKLAEVRRLQPSAFP